MSVKHIKNYYNQVCEQYKEMVDNIKDLEKEAEQGLIEPERIDRLKDQIAPIKQNYERWTYMMFLLNQPNKKDKIKKYEQQNRRLAKTLDKSNSISNVIQENKEAMKHIGE